MFRPKMAKGLILLVVILCLSSMVLGLEWRNIMPSFLPTMESISQRMLGADPEDVDHDKDFGASVLDEAETPLAIEVTEEQLKLHEPRPLQSDEWLLYLRIQKTGSKGFRNLLTTIGQASMSRNRMLLNYDEDDSTGLNYDISELTYTNKTVHARELLQMKKPRPPQRTRNPCGHGFFTSIGEDAKRSRCTAYQDCLIGMPNLLRQKQSSSSCKVVADQHCDLGDLTRPFVDAGQMSRVRLVVILRNPIKRVVSEFKHVTPAPQNVWDYCAKSAVKKMHGELSKSNFLHFLKDPITQQGMANRQTRMLSGDGPMDSVNMLERASANMLGENVIVGVTEMFIESGDLIKYALGIPLDDSHFDLKTVREPADNRKVAFEVDEEVTKAILMRNQLDAVLHEAAMKLVKYRYQQLLALQ